METQNEYVPKIPRNACLPCRYQEILSWNSKHIEANAQALLAHRNTLSKDYLSMVSHCDSAFPVWNTLTSLKLQTSNIVEEASSGDESDQPYYMVQGNDSLEVNSDTHLDDCASSLSDDYVDAESLNEELSLVLSLIHI